jgi:hypothetical protein
VYALQGLSVIQLLAEYTRINPPTYSEMHEVNITCNTNTPNDSFLKTFPLSSSHLPFQLTCSNTLVILNQELSLATISHLARISQSLDIHCDILYTNLIESIASAEGFELTDVSDLVERIEDDKTKVLALVSCARKLNGRERCIAYALGLQVAQSFDAEVHLI